MIKKSIDYKTTVKVSRWTVSTTDSQPFQATVPQTADCFHMGKTINQFRRLCYPLSYSPMLKDNSDPIYRSISSLDTEEADCETLYAVTLQTEQTEDDQSTEKYDHIFKMETKFDHYRLRKVKTAKKLTPP